MAAVPDATRIHQMTLPGTHDTGANFGCAIPGLGPWAKCQDMGIGQQLRSGLRVFDIRLHRAGNQFTIHHGPCNQAKTFDDVMKKVQRFLGNHPSEVVFMHYQEEWNAEPLSQPFGTIFASYLQRYGNLFDAGAYSSVAAIPSLGQLRGKVVLMSNSQNPRGFWEGSAQVKKSNDYHWYEVEQKWPGVASALDAARHPNLGDKLFITFTSANGMKDPGEMVKDFQAQKLAGVPTPKDFANSIHPKLREFLKARPGRQRYGIVLFDFPPEDLVRALAASNP